MVDNVYDDAKKTYQEDNSTQGDNNYIQNSTAQDTYTQQAIGPEYQQNKNPGDSVGDMYDAMGESEAREASNELDDLTKRHREGHERDTLEARAPNGERTLDDTFGGPYVNERELAMDEEGRRKHEETASTPNE